MKSCESRETKTVSDGMELWTVRRTADVLGISERALWNLTYPRGRLSVVRLGRSVRYRPEDVSEFVSANIEREGDRAVKFGGVEQLFDGIGHA